MARNLLEVIAAVQAERRAKIAAAYRQKLIAKKKKRQLEEAKRVIELDRNLIVIVVLIVTLPIIAALAAMLTVLAGRPLTQNSDSLFLCMVGNNHPAGPGHRRLLARWDGPGPSAAVTGAPSWKTTRLLHCSD
jgi:hypothetical protein